MKEYFKCLELPCGDDGLVVEVKEGDDMRQLFAKIKDLAYGVSGNKFEGSSWKLHKAAEALSDLWETAHAMSYFRVLSKYDSISDLRQRSLRPALNGLGKFGFSLLHKYRVPLVTLNIFIKSSLVNVSSIISLFSPLKEFIAPSSTLFYLIIKKCTIGYCINKKVMIMYDYEQ